MGTYFIGINALSIERNWGQSEGKYLYKYPAPITASYFLAAFFGLGAGFLEDTAAFLVGIFFALPPAFLATFFGALAVAFSFLAADLAASPMRAFSSADSLKQPDPFLPGCAPGTSTPSARIFFRALLSRPACLALVASTWYLLPRNFLMASREDPDFSFCTVIASSTISL